MKIIVLVIWHSHFKTTIVWHVWNALAGFTKSIYEGSKRLKNHVLHLLHELVKVTSEGGKTFVRSLDAPSLQILNQFYLVAFLSSLCFLGFLSMLHLFWAETACYHIWYIIYQGFQTYNFSFSFITEIVWQPAETCPYPWQAVSWRCHPLCTARTGIWRKMTSGHKEKPHKPPKHTNEYTFPFEIDCGQ